MQIKPIEHLEMILDQFNNKEMSKEIIKYKNFKWIYNDKAIFKHHVKFLLDNCYNIKLV